MAEVTLVIDNSDRAAPAEYNDQDLIEVTRRIERESGSAYRINGNDVRQKMCSSCSQMPPPARTRPRS